MLWGLFYRLILCSSILIIKGQFKMDFKMKYIFITAALLTSPLVQATTDEALHVISAWAGMGFLSGEMDQDNNDFELNYDFAYRYQFDNNWGADVGYRHQDVTFTNWFDSAFDKYSLNDAESFRIAAVYSLTHYHLETA